MRVEPTFSSYSYRHQYGKRNDQLHTRTSAQFTSRYGRFELYCITAWQAQFDETAVRTICHRCNLRIPPILPLGVINGVVKYYDYPHAMYFARNGYYVLNLSNQWRASLTRLVKNIPVVDELPQETERIERWLERRLVNCFACL